MSTYAKKRRRFSGSIAIPFLLTLLISTIVLGSVGYYFFKKIINDDKELLVMPGATTGISEEDIYEILFVLEPDSPARKTAVMLMRFDPIRKQEYYIGIPLNLQVEREGTTMTLEQCIDNYGVSDAKDVLSVLFDQKIDYYIRMDSTGFQKISTVFGNVSCLVSIHDENLKPDDVSQDLDATQLETLLTSVNYYSEGERTAVIGQTIAQLVNQSDSKRIASNVDGYFSSVIGSVTSNISAIDFTDHRHAILFVLEQSEAPAMSYTVFGIESDGIFIMNENYPAQLKEIFMQTAVAAE